MESRYCYAMERNKDRKKIYRFRGRSKKDQFVIENKNIGFIKYTDLKILFFPMNPGELKEYKWFKENELEYIIIHIRKRFNTLKYILTNDDEHFIIHYKHDENGKKYYIFYNRKEWEDKITFNNITEEIK